MQKAIDNINFEEAFIHCEKITKNHYENFPVASVLIPKEKRKYVYAVYSFARYADDISDSAILTSEEKLTRLNFLEDELDRILNNQLENLHEETKYIFIALYKTLQVLNIPTVEFKSLLIAFKQDSIKDKYDTFEELLEYSKYSANPVGHLVLYIFGYNEMRDKKLFELSDYICTGLQLINFWQDVDRDLEINRVYIPNEVLQKHNYSYELLNDKEENENYINIIKELITKTKELYKKGEELPNLVSGRLKYELKATYYGGLTVINKIEQLNYRTLTTRPVVSGSDKFKILLKTIF
ncbi:MAG: squalene synthase HpnC [Ignavibacteria bacterium]|nr:squalene synthase HpnC [Ignavibacteria bacterium]